MGLRSLPYKTAKYMGDYNAAQKGKAIRRVGRPQGGKATGSAFRKLVK